MSSVCQLLICTALSCAFVPSWSETVVPSVMSAMLQHDDARCHEGL